MTKKYIVYKNINQKKNISKKKIPKSTKNQVKSQLWPPVGTPR